MKGIKTKGGTGRQRAFAGELRVLRQQNPFLYDVELWMLNEKLTHNNWRFINLEEHRALFAGTPILIAYINQGAGIGDGHNFKVRRDPKTGRERPSFTDADAERIIGSLSDDPEDIRLEERDGVTWIVGKGSLWKWYAPEVVDKIASDAVQGRNMSVSIEALIDSFHMEGDVEIEERYTPLGTTILGDHVAPAVDGARVVAMAGGFEAMKLRAASYREGTQGTKKGGSMTMNKKSAERLAPKFPGYKIIGLSADEKQVALADQAGNTFSYTFGEDDQGEVILAKVKPVNLSAKVCAVGEEDGLAVDVDEILDYVTNGVRDQGTTIQNLNGQLEQAKEMIRSLEEAEHKRRVQSVKDMLKRTLEEIQTAEGDDTAELAEEVKKLEDKAEEYAQAETKEGAFCGAEQARKDLMALHGERRCAQARKQAEAKRGTFLWDEPQKKQTGAHDGGIEGLLSSLGF